MADFYVSPAGSGAHDGSTTSDAFSTAEMITDWATAASGSRYLIVSGAHSFGTATVAAGMILQGYASTDDDLRDVAYDSSGFLDTTGFPVVTCTGTLTVATSAVTKIRCLDFTGSVNGALIGNVTNDSWGMEICRVTNTANNAAAQALVTDNGGDYEYLDLSCTGASHGTVFEADSITRCWHVRATSTSASATCIDLRYPSDGIYRCTFDSAGGTCLRVESAAADLPIEHCTFYGSGGGSAAGILFVSATGAAHLRNNHATDMSKWLEVPSGTKEVLESGTRTRDVTTLRTGLYSGLAAFGAITTDTGGAETDYTDAANGDFRLIDGAPGARAGIAGQTCGAWEQVAVSGGGGGCGMIGPGGGMIGRGY
jgi:hypothetical protein